MTLNKIKSECPLCDSTTADVLGLIESEKKVVVVVKCISEHHQYTFDAKGNKTQWKKFFK